MFIERPYIKHKALILRDIDGTSVAMPLQDALELLAWLKNLEQEMIAALQEPDEKETFAVN